MINDVLRTTLWPGKSLPPIRTISRTLTVRDVVRPRILGAMQMSVQDERDELVDDFVKSARRRGGAVPLRTSLVQSGAQSTPVHGPLHKLVRNHDERGLDLYLMLRAKASSDQVSGAWDVRHEASVWASGLGLPTPLDDGSAAVSKAWRRLANLGLIERSRQKRLSNITLLDESGDGSPYVYPSGKGAGRYFKLSEDFWTADERWYRTLSLSAKAMLLVSSSLKPGFVLPLEQAPKWYGISPATAAIGFNELSARGLLDIVKNRRREPKSPTKYVLENQYALRAPFAQNHTRAKLATVTALPSATAAKATGS